MSEKVFSKGELRTFDSIRCEELRVICGTRGIPGTVAPFRAWRGSRDLVAQSPKFHAPAVARVRASAEKILTHSFAGMAQGGSTSPPAFCSLCFSCVVSGPLTLRTYSLVR